MRTRILAALLALTLIGSLLGTAAFAEEAGGGTPQAETAADEAKDAEAAAAAETGEAADQEEPAAEALPQPDPVGQLSFANLASRVRENNFTVLALEESIASVNAIDFDKMKDDLRDQLNGIAKAQYIALTAPDVLAAMGMGDATYSSLQSSYNALKDTFDDLQDGKIQDDYAAAVRQLQNGENQLVQGAETLYISILELENSRAKVQRQLDSLDRTVREMELRYELGQISALQLEQVKAGRTQAQSGLDTLDMNLKNLTVQLEQMIGAEQTGTLTLMAAPGVSGNEIANMDLERDLAAAKEVSYTLFAAQETLDTAKETYEDAIDGKGLNSYQRKSAEHTWQAAQYTYQATVQSFEQAFRQAYNSVGDHRQILQAAETALALQQNTYASMELKYQQGSISKNALASAKNDLADAQATVTTAQHDLLTAYRTYTWAVDQGLLN